MHVKMRGSPRPTAHGSRPSQAFLHTSSAAAICVKAREACLRIYMYRRIDGNCCASVLSVLLSPVARVLGSGRSTALINTLPDYCCIYQVTYCCTDPVLQE